MDFKEEKNSKCRVCLGAVKKKDMSLFEHYKNLPLYSHIISIANVTIRENDGFPDKICSQCLQDLNTAISFKNKCEKSDMVLQTTTFENLRNADENKTLELRDCSELKEEPEEGNDVSIRTNTGDAFQTFDDFKSEDQTLIKSDVKKEDGPHFINDQVTLKSEGVVEDNTTDIVDDTTRNYTDDDGDETLAEDYQQKPVFKSKAIDLHLQCDDCKDYFKSKCKLRVHWKKVHEPKQLTCQSCKRGFKKYKSYHSHRKNRPKLCIEAANFRIEGVGKSRIVYCKDCSHKSLRVRDMISHRVRHTGERPFTCDKCGQSHTQLSALTAHRETHGEYKFEITCQYCGEHIKGRDRAAKHLKRHTDQSMKCEICSKTLKNINTLKIHMLRHKGIKNVHCDLCEMSFITTAECIMHKRVVHLKSKYEYACDLCGYKSSKKIMVTNHRKRHVGSFVCCTQCGKFFENAQKLSEHQRHHIEKNHVCQHCNKEYYRKDHLTRHIKKIHLCKTAPIVRGQENKKETIIQISN